MNAHLPGQPAPIQQRLQRLLQDDLHAEHESRPRARDPDYRDRALPRAVLRDAAHGRSCSATAAAVPTRWMRPCSPRARPITAVDDQVSRSLDVPIFAGRPDLRRDPVRRFLPLLRRGPGRDPLLPDSDGALDASVGYGPLDELPHQRGRHLHSHEGARVPQLRAALQLGRPPGAQDARRSARGAPGPAGHAARSTGSWRRSATTRTGCRRTGTATLAAYYVSSREVPEAELRRHLAETLPAPLDPAGSSSALDALPLTPNGKIDVAALRAAAATANAVRRARFRGA